MSEKKPKYIRKKCEHNKYSFQCKDCKGKSLCEHGTQQYYCKKCGGKGICEHNRIKQNCVDCHGQNICEHNKSVGVDVYCVKEAPYASMENLEAVV